MRSLPRPGPARLHLLASLMLMLLPPAARGDCGKPAPIPNAGLRSGTLQNRYTTRTVLTFRCIPGYELIPATVPRITCSGTEWQPKSPQFCQGRRCPDPNVAHGRIVSSTDFRLGDRITIACNAGYRLLGDKTARCTLKAGRVDWDNRPTCERIPCFPPPRVTNGMISGHVLGEYDYGSSVTYICDKGYSLIGKKNLVCGVAADGQNGAWDSPPPECKVVVCRRPDITHGSISASQPSYAYDHTLVITCDVGYSLLGASIIKCGADNNWHPALPTCVFGTIVTTVSTTIVSGGGSIPDTTTSAFTTVLSGGGTTADDSEYIPTTPTDSENKPEPFEEKPGKWTLILALLMLTV